MDTPKLDMAGHVALIPGGASGFLVNQATQHSSLPSVSARDAEQPASRPEIFSRTRVLAGSPSLRMAIKLRGRILFTNLSDVVAIQAEGKCVSLQLNANSYRLHESISVLAEKLEAHGFIRIHRSVLVNTAFVKEIRRLSTGEYCLRVEGGKEYTVTRTYKKILKSLAEFRIGTGTFL